MLELLIVIGRALALGVRTEKAVLVAAVDVRRCVQRLNVWTPFPA
jgi:hypothetical protein